MQSDIKEKGKWAWARFGDFNNLSGLLDLLGWKTQVIALLSSLGIFGWIWEPGNRPLAVLIALLAGIFVSCISLLWQVTQGTRKKDRTKIPSSGIDVPASIEFYGTIDDLRARHPLSETFKPGNEIHAYFLSGEGVFAEHSEYIKCVKRLILPMPESNTIASIQSLSGTNLDYKSQIYRYRDLAKKNNVPVRLFQEFIGVSLLFCNPNHQDGWGQVGIIIPGSESSERHHYRLYRAKHEMAFLSLYKTFECLWDRSETDSVQGVTSPEVPSEFISMKRAATDLYSEVREKKHVLAKMAERSSGRNLTAGSPDDILDQMATYIAISKKVSVHGKRVPSNRREQISSNDVRASHFTEGATKLVNIHKQSIYFTDLEIKRSDFDDVIDEVQIDDGFYR